MSRHHPGALAPQPGELLWDVWRRLRLHRHQVDARAPALSAIAIEADAGRQAHIHTQPRCARCAGLCRLVAGRAPETLAGLSAPDAIFIGGGVTIPGVLEQCWSQPKPGGRLVANAVTLQSEAALVAWREQVGGELTRISVAQAQPLGGFDTWRSALPITLLEVRRREPAHPAARHIHRGVTFGVGLGPESIHLAGFTFGASAWLAAPRL